jgi:hypothetical protein
MTALGAVVVWRAYFACRACGTGGYLADAWLGLEGYLTRGPPGWFACSGAGAPSPSPSDS